MGDEVVSADDAVLVKAFQTGDREAFDRLVIKHKDRVFTVCYWFLGDHAEASDYSQETFIKAFRSLKRFRFESAFSTWLYRIAVNTCKNRLKSSQYRKKKKTMSLNDLQCTTDCALQDAIPDRSPSPMGELENKMTRMKIYEAIDSLPPEQKTVVVLRDIQGLSYEEIVDISGFGMGTVKSRLARARSTLRDILRSER
jgi:RNA polymerase sigma-70 factor (ECF subfamily)